MKLGLALCGGGAKGSYEVGVINALVEHGYKFDVVTGTSIGALNGAIVVQQQIDVLNQLWFDLNSSNLFADDLSQIKLTFNIDELVQSKNLLTSFFKTYAKEKGADITPFIAFIKRYLDYDRLINSPIEYGSVCVEFPSLKPVLTSKYDYGNSDEAFNYLLASASCYPAFPKANFNNKHYIDGGYYDNLPIDYCFQFNPNKVIAIDLNVEPTHPSYLNHPSVDTIYPSVSLGNFLDVSHQHIMDNISLGYLDGKKYLNDYIGFKYTFKKNKIPTPLEWLDQLMMHKGLTKEVSILLEKTHRKVDGIHFGLLVLEELMDLMEYSPYVLYDLDDIIKDLYAYYNSVSNQKFDLQALQELKSTLSKKEILLRIILHMVNEQNYNFTFGVVSKIADSTMAQLRAITFMILVLLDKFK